MLIRNISYMERELSEMKKELAVLDAKWEQQEQAVLPEAEEAILKDKQH